MRTRNIAPDSIKLILYSSRQTESTCCSGGKQPKPPKEKKPKKQKPKKPDPSEKVEGKVEPKPEAGKSSGKEKEKSGKPSPYQVFEKSLMKDILSCFAMHKKAFLVNFEFTRIFIDFSYPFSLYERM